MMILWIIAQLIIGTIYTLFLEWGLHIFLHKAGRKRGQIFSFHFHQHHRASRKNEFIDKAYQQNPFLLNSASKELVSLGILAIPHLMLFPVAPYFVLTALFFAGRYYYYHRKCHIDVEWCKKHMPWHYDHHMAPNQHANWGVTTDFFDRLFGTKELYLGTEREIQLRKRQEARS